MSRRMPWEKRLEDLAHTLKNCDATYFEPELFRRNTNHFLQTARTVTFLIQKNRESIPDYNLWYQRHVIDAWKDDLVMKWAKGARNFIEKEGDLETYSSIKMQLVFSYLEEEDFAVDLDGDQILYCNVARLIKFAERTLPRGVQKASAVRVERCWITSTLPSHELLSALGYVYARLHECAVALACHMERRLPTTIPNPSKLCTFTQSSERTVFIKLKNFEMYRLGDSALEQSARESLPQEMKDRVLELNSTLGRPRNFEKLIEFYSEMAQSTFEYWGYHTPMVFFFDEDWSLRYLVSPQLDDQAEKYIFWRMLSERVRIQQPHCILHIGEAWIRRLTNYPESAIEDMEIIGEALGLEAFDRCGNFAQLKWSITRPEANGAVMLGECGKGQEWEGVPTYFIPSMRALGVPIRGETPHPK